MKIDEKAGEKAASARHRKAVMPKRRKALGSRRSSLNAGEEAEVAQLRRERDEALERQTATADILKVIASSPSDVQPVFEAIAQRSNRLLGGLSTAV